MHTLQSQMPILEAWAEVPDTPLDGLCGFLHESTAHSRYGGGHGVTAVTWESQQRWAGCDMPSEWVSREMWERINTMTFQCDYWTKFASLFLERWPARKIYFSSIWHEPCYEVSPKSCCEKVVTLGLLVLQCVYPASQSFSQKDEMIIVRSC